MSPNTNDITKITDGLFYDRTQKCIRNTLHKCINAKSASLDKRSSELLDLLIENANMTLKNEDILDKMFGGDPDKGSDSTIKTYISRLRLKIHEVLPEGYDIKRIIETVNKKDAKNEKPGYILYIKEKTKDFDKAIQMCSTPEQADKCRKEKLLSYKSCPVDMIGCDILFAIIHEKLNSFLTSELFLITGKESTGKSRFAYEMQKLAADDNFVCIWVEPEYYSKTGLIEELEKIKLLKRPLLIVFDNVEESVELMQAALVHLNEIAKSSAVWSVCTSREDMSGLETVPFPHLGSPIHFDLNRSVDSNKENIKVLIKDVSDKMRPEAPSVSTVYEHLEHIDPDLKRPLFAMAITLLLIEGKNIDNYCEEDILNYVGEKTGSPKRRAKKDPGLFWDAGHSWYLSSRAPGARFSSLDIIDGILPGGSDIQPAKGRPVLPLRIEDKEGHIFEGAQLSNILKRMPSEGPRNIVLIGEGGVGKTTTLFSVMQDIYHEKKIFRNDIIIPLFIELSMTPDIKECPAYDGSSSTVIYRLIYSMLLQTDSSKDRNSLTRECMYDPDDTAREKVSDYLTHDKSEIRYVLLIDGLNELPYGTINSETVSIRDRVLREIHEIAGRFPNVTLVLTSRTAISLNKDTFKTYYLQGLEEEQIWQYLLDNGKAEEEVQRIFDSEQGLTELLRIPLFLTMYVELKDTSGINSRGELLREFLYERRDNYGIYNLAHRQEDIEKDRLKMSKAALNRLSKITLPMQWLFLDVVLPEIAVRMAGENRYQINEDDVGSILKELFGEDSVYKRGLVNEYYRKVFSCRQGVSNETAKTLQTLMNSFLNSFEKDIDVCREGFLEYCITSIGILYREGSDSYSFIHQHFRDYYAAVWYIHRMKAALTQFKKGNSGNAISLLKVIDEKPLNPMLMVLIGEILGEHHNHPVPGEQTKEHTDKKEKKDDRHLIEEILDVYRGIEQTNSRGVYNLVEILKRSRIDLSGIDFSKLDLRRCRFNGIHFDTIPGTKFTDAVVDLKQWLPIGHNSKVKNIDISLEGKHVVTASFDSTARIWDAETGEELHVLEGHSDKVTSAVFNREGTRIVTASYDNTARVWDAESGEELHVLKGHSDIVTSAAFNQKGTHVVTASGDGTARIWDVETGEELHVLEGHIDIVTSAVFNREGTRIVTASYDNTARVWDAESGEELYVLQGHRDGVISAVFNEEGTCIVTASCDGTSRVWDAGNGEERHVLDRRDHVLYRAVFNRDGTRIATASGDGTARVWDAETGEKLHVLQGHRDRVTVATFNREGNHIVTNSWDGTARIWDVETGEELHVLEGHSDKVTSAVFNRDGTRVATASGDGTARVWDTKSGEELNVLEGHCSLLASAVFNEEGTRIVTVSRDGSARVWDAESGKELCVLQGHVFPIKSAVFNRDGTRIVTVSRDGSLRVWDADNGKELHVLEGHGSLLTSAVFNEEGTRVVTVFRDGSARVWDAESGKGLCVLQGHVFPIKSAVFNRDGTRVATASGDGTARVWDAESGKELCVLQGLVLSIKSPVFNYDGTCVVTASGDGTARVWDAESGKELHVLRHNNTVYDAVFNQEGTRILTTSTDGWLRVWDTKTGKELHALEGHDRLTTHAVFNQEGTRIVAISFMLGTVRVWDAESGEELHEPGEHDRPITSAVLNQEKTRIVTGFKDGTTRIWDVETGEELHVLKGHSDEVTSAAFNQKGTRIVTTSEDLTTRVWDVESGNCIHVLYEIPGLYVNGVDFRDIDYKSIATTLQKKQFEQYGALMQ